MIKRFIYTAHIGVLTLALITVGLALTWAMSLLILL
jgi:hypothetical protein